MMCHHVVSGRVRHLAALNADGQIFVGRERGGTFDLPNVFGGACCRNPPKDLVNMKQYAAVAGSQGAFRVPHRGTVSGTKAVKGNYRNRRC